MKKKRVSKIKKKTQLSKKVIFAVAFSLICAGVFLLRIFNLASLDLWRDEAYSVTTATHTPAQIIALSSQDTMPPLYDLLIHVWIQLFGPSEFSVRIPSLIFNMGTFALTILTARRYFGKKSVLSIGLLFACNMVSIFFAREARVYSLLTFFIIGSFYLFLLISEKSFSLYPRWKKRLTYTTYIIVTSISLYSHSLALFAIMTQIFVITIAILKKRTNLKNFWKSLRPWFLLWIMIFICWLPWCASFINQAQRVSSDFWLTFSPVHSPQQTISGLINGIRLFTQEPFSLAFSLYTFVALGLLIYGTKKDLKQFPGSFPLCYFFWLPLIFMFLVSFLRPILYMRYASFLFPFMIMLIYQGLSHLPTKFYKVAVFSILLCAQLNIYIFYVTTTDSKPHYSELVDYLEHNVNGNEAIIHINSLSFFPVHYYAQIFYDETPLEAPISIYDPNHLTPHYTGTALLEENDFTRDLTVLAKFDRLWLIEEGATTGRLDFIDSYSLLATYQFEGNLHLELWQKNEKTCNCDAHI